MFRVQYFYLTITELNKRNDNNYYCPKITEERNIEILFQLNLKLTSYL